jgi:hypothetical protein
MTKCDDCVNLKHRYSLLTGLSYIALQTALNTQRIKAEAFRCEGMGCKFIMFGDDIDFNETPDIDWSCPYFEPPKEENPKDGERIDSHANTNEYPNPHFLIVKNGKITIERFGETKKE